MSGHAPTSRSREAPQGDEEAAAELKLGEFQDVDALTHSEAALVINALVQKRTMDRKNMNETEYVPSILGVLELWVGKGGQWDTGAVGGVYSRRSKAGRCGLGDLALERAEGEERADRQAGC